MRVAWVVTPLSTFGGTLTHLRQWHDGLSKANVSPHLLYFCPEEAAGVSLDLPKGLRRKALHGLDLRRRTPLRAVRELYLALRELRVDLVHTVFIGGDLLGLLAARLAALPVVSSIEGELLVRTLGPAKRMLLATAYRILSPKFAAVTAVSQETARDAASRLGKGSASIDVIYPGVTSNPPQKMRPLRAGPRMIFVGRISMIKALPTLIEACVRLKREFPDLMLTCVGDGPDRCSVESLVRDRGLSENIRFIGWVGAEEVGRAMDEAHVLVLPSRSEGLPWVALEAMARGLPVVASAVGGLPELILEEPKEIRNGCLVQPESPAELAATLEKVFQGKRASKRLRQVGERARERVERCFRADQEVAALLGVYANVLGASFKSAPHLMPK